MNFFGSSKNYNPKSLWFFTFPKSPTINPLETYINNLATKYVIKCDELHKDGTPHQHFCVQLLQPTKKTTIINKIKEILPSQWKRIHVRPVRNFSASIQYCKKDGNYEETGTPDLGGYRRQRLPRQRKRKLTDEDMFRLLSFMMEPVQENS